MKWLRPALWIFLALAPGAAVAGDGYASLRDRLTPAQLEQLALTPKQLAQLDAMLEANAAATAPTAATPVAPAGRPVPRITPANEIDTNRFAGFSDGPIQGRVVGTVTGWATGTVFVLTNGQHWTVMKGERTLRAPLVAPEIEVVPGVAGRWFLRVDPDLPMARVYRTE